MPRLHYRGRIFRRPDDGARALRIHGAKLVGTVGEFAEAIEAIEQNSFDVAILECGGSRATLIKSLTM